MRTLGFSVGHDKGAVIIENGKVVIGITQERLSRIKHDGGFSEGQIPLSSINYCLNELGLTFKDIDSFVYSTTEISDNVEEQFRNITNNTFSRNLKFIPHHLAHAYSTFFSSGFEESAVVVGDASGSILSEHNQLKNWYSNKDRGNLNDGEDWTEAISIYHFTKNKYEEVHKQWMSYPSYVNNNNESISLGMMYSNGSRQIVYSPDNHSWSAGKLMGLASYGDKNVIDNAEEFVKEIDGNLYIPNHYLYPNVDFNSDFYSKACVAGIYQREQERAAFWLAQKAKELTDSKNICVAGGSFLNCNSNEKILNSGLYENCYFIPPSDDSGIPLGCAWYAYQELMDIKETQMFSPYIGKTYSRNEVISVLNDHPNLVYTEFNKFNELTEHVSDLLAQNRVIGWFQDGSEIGPRALGNRSILASPINSWMTGHINGDIKMREWYRPFAPAVLFEHQKDIFESDVYSPYMLVTTTIKEEWRKRIPAVNHIDNSARHQSVTEKSNPKFYNLIEKFYNRTGVPVLLNTSFNGPTEPIVETPREAIATFLERNINFLVINNFLISRV